MIAITTISSSSVNAFSNSESLLMALWTVRGAPTHAAEPINNQETIPTKLILRAKPEINS